MINLLKKKNLSNSRTIGMVCLTQPYGKPMTYHSSSKIDLNETAMTGHKLAELAHVDTPIKMTSDILENAMNDSMSCREIPVTQI